VFDPKLDAIIAAVTGCIDSVAEGEARTREMNERESMIFDEHACRRDGKTWQQKL